MIFSDLSKCDSAWSEAMGFFDSCGDGCGLPGDFLSDELFSGYFLSSGFSGGLFGSSHNVYRSVWICDSIYR